MKNLREEKQKNESGNHEKQNWLNWKHRNSKQIHTDNQKFWKLQYFKSQKENEKKNKLKQKTKRNKNKIVKKNQRKQNNEKSNENKKNEKKNKKKWNRLELIGFNSRS